MERAGKRQKGLVFLGNIAGKQTIQSVSHITVMPFIPQSEFDNSEASNQRLTFCEASSESYQNDKPTKMVKLRSIKLCLVWNSGEFSLSLYISVVLLWRTDSLVSSQNSFYCSSVKQNLVLSITLLDVMGTLWHCQRHTGLSVSVVLCQRCIIRMDSQLECHCTQMSLGSIIQADCRCRRRTSELLASSRLTVLL